MARKPARIERAGALPHAHAHAHAHTQGRARIAIETGPCVIVVGKREICECYQDGETQTVEDQGNALRIVECWNAYDNLVAQVLLLKYQRNTLTELLRQATARKPMRAETYHIIKAALKELDEAAHGA